MASEWEGRPLARRGGLGVRPPYRRGYAPPGEGARLGLLASPDEGPAGVRRPRGEETWPEQSEGDGPKPSSPSEARRDRRSLGRGRASRWVPSRGSMPSEEWGGPSSPLGLLGTSQGPRKGSTHWPGPGGQPRRGLRSPEDVRGKPGGPRGTRGPMCTRAEPE